MVRSRGRDSAQQEGWPWQAGAVLAGPAETQPPAGERRAGPQLGWLGRNRSQGTFVIYKTPFLRLFTFLFPAAENPTGRPSKDWRSAVAWAVEFVERSVQDPSLPKSYYFSS